MALKDIPVEIQSPTQDQSIQITLIKNSFDVDDLVFHGLMALGVLKEIGIRTQSKHHKRWAAFMKRTARFDNPPNTAPWTREEFLEYANLILEMSDPQHPAYAYARDAIKAITDFSPQSLLDYEHLINVGACTNRPPYTSIRI